MRALALLPHQIRYLLTGKPSSLTLYVTDRCTLACRTCFVRPGTNEPPMEFFRSLSREVPRLLWLDIGGGEPFLRGDLPAICRLFPASVLAIPTNGQDAGTIVPLVRDLARDRQGDVVISLSLDGPEHLHERVRGKGTWQRALATFEALKGVDGIALKVNTVVTRDNLEALPQFVAWVRAQGADGHSLIVLRGDPRDPSLSPPPPEELRAVAPAILAQLRRYRYAHGPLGARLLWAYHRTLWSLTAQTLEQARQVVPCLAGRNHLVVWADRSVGPCELLEPVARLDGTTLEEVRRSEAWRSTCDAIAQGRCWCTHNCALLASALFHPPCLLRMVAAAVRGS